MQPDLAGLVPEARPVAQAVAEVYWRHTRPWFVGLVCFGSAVRGGIIPGASDVDFHLFLTQDAFTPEGVLPLPLALAIHRDLAHIDPAPFRYIDGGAETGFLPEGHIGYVPGTYHLLAGRCPLPEATAAGLTAQAASSLDRLEPAPGFVSEALLHTGSGLGALALTVRALCQKVWPVLYQTACLHHPQEAVAVWQTHKDRICSWLPADREPGRAGRSFYAAVRRYYPAEAPVEAGLVVIESGVAFLQAVQAWYATYTAAHR